MHLSVQLWWNDNESIKTKYSDKPCPRATLSTTNLTWTDPGRYPGPRDVQLAITGLILKYVCVYIYIYIYIYIYVCVYIYIYIYIYI